MHVLHIIVYMLLGYVAVKAVVTATRRILKHIRQCTRRVYFLRTPEDRIITVGDKLLIWESLKACRADSNDVADSYGFKYLVVDWERLFVLKRIARLIRAEVGPFSISPLCIYLMNERDSAIPQEK